MPPFLCCTGSWNFIFQRFAHPPTGQSRWTPPIPFVSNEPQNATSFGPACFQQFAFGDSPALMESIFNDPPQVENEDCLFMCISKLSEN